MAICTTVGRERKITVVLAVLSRNLVLACSSVAPAPVEPTPNIDAIVETKGKEASISVPMTKR